MGFLISFIGLVFLVFTLFLDFFLGKPQLIGPVQRILIFSSLIILCLGLFLLQNKDQKKTVIKNNNFEKDLIKNFLLIAVIILFLINPIRFTINFLSLKFPIEYRDAAAISAAVDFSRGINPYTVENFPGHIYLYGFLYPLIMAPFMKFVAHPILVARFMDVLFSILFLSISFWILRKRNSSIITSLIAILILLNSFCLIWLNNGSRSDASGLFFSILGICFLLRNPYKIIHILFCAISFTISFHFKQYMVFPALAVALYLFLFVSKQKGIIFVVFGISIGLLSFIVAKSIFPLWYEYSIIHHIEANSSYITLMYKQTITFFKYYWILFILFLLYIYKHSSVFNFGKVKEIRLIPFDIKEPFIRGISIELLDLSFIISALFLTFYFGRKGGNTYTYYGELLLPFLIYSIIPKIDKLFEANFFQSIIKILILYFCVFLFQSNYLIDFKSLNNSFTNLYQYVDQSQCTNIYDKTPLVSLYKIENNLNPIFNNGQIDYARSVIPTKKSGIFGKISTAPAEILNTRLINWQNEIERNINDQKFDCIILSTDEKIENYDLVAKFEKIRKRTIYFWTPTKQ